MRVILCKDYAEMSEKAARIIAGQVNLKPDCILGLATGSTPVGAYEKLAELYKLGEVDFSQVRSFNLDEYYPIKNTNRQSYRYFMNENLFSKINIDIKNTHVPNGEADDPDLESENYERAIAQSGGIDLQLLGIGQNGHIGFNEPDANLNTSTHLTKLTANTMEVNSRFFSEGETIPDKAITMGISTILKAKKIILLASGENKSDAVAELMTNKIKTDVPATMLKTHHDVVLICDEAAYSKVK